jgi:hypothetical protein
MPLCFRFQLRSKKVVPVGDDRHVQVFVESDETGWGEGQREEVGKREPVPILSKNLENWERTMSKLSGTKSWIESLCIVFYFTYQHSNDRHHVGVSSSGLKADSHVAATSINDALSEDGTQLSHNVLVLVSDDLENIR